MAAQALAGRHQLPYKATELWQRLMWQSMGPCLAAVYSHLMSPWQSFMANREVALIAALPWSTMAAVEVCSLQGRCALDIPVPSHESQSAFVEAAKGYHFQAPDDCGSWLA